MSNLYDKLLDYSKSEIYPMHMPGHKRNTKLLPSINPYAIDITEIEGFDNLHHPKEILQDLILRIQELYGSPMSVPLINGSTVGILAGISSCVEPGDRILVARNSHKAVYHAIQINQLRPVYVYPQDDGIYHINGGILPEDIENLLITYEDIKLVVITSPTYEGIISDIEAIARITHKYNVPLLVDEAHGAHLGFHSGFPKNSIAAGADIVIHSAHKTLPAYTQTALMHIQGNLVKKDEVQKYLGIYETSSPSYVLLAGIDTCIQLLETEGTKLFELYYERLKEFYNKTKGFQQLRILHKDEYDTLNLKQNGVFQIDPSKIVISTLGTTISGKELETILRNKYKIQLEMSSLHYALAMTSICDTDEGFQRLYEALLELNEELKEQKEGICSADMSQFEVICKCYQEPLEITFYPYQVEKKTKEEITLTDCVGRVCGAYIMLYPPGIPLIVPGEIISEAVVSCIESAKHLGFDVLGLKGNDDNYIEVIPVPYTEK